MLQENEIRPSLTRIHILAYLLTNPVHPTVEQIYQAHFYRKFHIIENYRLQYIRFVLAKKVVKPVELNIRKAL